MKVQRKIIAILTTIAIAGVSSAYAAGHNSTASFKPATQSHSTDIGSFHFSNRDFTDRKRINGASETASFYYRVGINHYEAKKFNDAERAFKAVLRADGLNAESYIYLARIAEAKGDLNTAEVFAKKYFELTKG